MKQVKYIFVFIFFLIFTTTVNASSFQPRASLYESYDGSGIVYINLWYEGPAINEIENSFKYDATYFEIDDITSDVFELNTSMEEKDGKYRILTISAEADEDYEGETYAIIALRLKSNYKVGDTTYLTLSDYFANTSEGKKYKNDGLIINVNYHSRNDIFLFAYDRTEETERNMWINDHLYYFLFIIVLIFIVIAIFLITPHNYLSGNRSRRVKNNIKNNKFNGNVKNIKIDVDDIASIGEKPKEEPKNKLELGKFNPLASNKSKPKQHISKDRDFKETKVSPFKK